MTNRWYITLGAVVISLGLLWVGRELRKVVDRTDSFETFLPVNRPQNSGRIFPPEAIMTNLEIHGRKVIGNTPPPQDPLKKKNYILANKVSPHWREGVKKALFAQGGSTLKDVEVRTLDSFIWSVGGQALNVESVHIQVENDQGRKTTFNALVDSQSGRIIQSWNQPIIDHANPRLNPGVKIDPRYLHD